MTLWTPAQLTQANLAWIDPNVSTTLNGSVVVSIGNRGGLGSAVVSQKVSQSPSILTNTQNGLSVVNFTGAQRLYQPAVARPGGPLNIFAVASSTLAENATNANFTPTLFGLNNEGDGTSFTAFQRTLTNGAAGDNNWQSTSYNSSDTLLSAMSRKSIGAAYDGTMHVLSMRSSAVGYGMWEDGTTLIIDSTSQSASENTYGDFVASNNTVGFGADDGTSNTIDPWYGYLGESIMYFGTLSDSDRQRCEGYLAWRWGTQSKLSSTHPYKNAAPTIPLPSKRSVYFY